MISLLMFEYVFDLKIVVYTCVKDKKKRKKK